MAASVPSRSPIASFSDAERLRLLERLKLARKMVGSVDALDRFMAWRAPDER